MSRCTTAPRADASSAVSRRRGCRAAMTVELSPLPNGTSTAGARAVAIDDIREADPPPRLVIQPEYIRSRPGRSSRIRSPTSRDHRVEVELFRKRGTDLVDDGELRVALARLLDRPGTRQRSRDVLATKVSSSRSSRRVATVLAVVWTATTPIVRPSALSGTPIHSTAIAPTRFISPCSARCRIRSTVTSCGLRRAAARRRCRRSRRRSRTGSTRWGRGCPRRRGR